MALSGHDKRSLRRLPSDQEEDAGERPVEYSSKRLRSRVKILRRAGLDGAARQVAGLTVGGIPALSSNPAPQTIAEALGRLPDNERVMLLRAAQGDREAREQAIATIALWWDAMPQTIRHNIDFRVAQGWKREHSNASARTVSARKFHMLISKLRDGKTGAQNLNLAGRLPA